MGLTAQQQSQAYLDYIEQWKDVAIQQQADYGIPASITMAQALLESAAGQSELALNAKNHFGIKCNNDWFGGVYYYDDDSKGECFRQYADATESFKDHSLFLQRPRYATCFEIAVEDYEGWAYRLKECGYATDSRYAPKLIKLIEDYHLDALTTGKPVGTYDPTAKQDIRNKEPQPSGEVNAHASAAPIAVITHNPEPPYVAPKTARMEREEFYLAHPKKRNNGVAYVQAREGDTFANVAFRLNVRERDLREHNDALGRDMHIGDRIYLTAKKKSSTKEYVWTRKGQSLWQLSQDEGVQMKAIQKLNELDPSVREFTIRQKLYLKKVKEEKK